MEGSIAGCLFAKSFLGGGTELVVQGVGLLQEFLADAVEAHLGLLCTGALNNLLTKVIVKVNGLVYEVCNFIRILSGVYVQEQRAVVHKCTDHVLNVFFDVSKIHISLN